MKKFTVLICIMFWACSNVGPLEAEDKTEALIQQLSDPSPEVRADAVIELGSQ